MRIRILGAVAFMVLLVGLGRPQPIQAAGCGLPEQDQFFLAKGFLVNKDLCVVSLRHPKLDFYRAFPAQNADGTVNTVTEIPAGTNDKFEVGEDTGKMCWELKNGVPRKIKFLGYPANYGNVPRTMGGDGDSLDMLTLGKFERRGAVVAAKLIGVMHMVDGGDLDDKLIGVLPDTEFSGFNNLSELEAKYPGVTSIIGTWFESYKGPGEIEVTGFGDAKEAQTVLDEGKAAFVE